MTRLAVLDLVALALALPTVLTDVYAVALKPAGSPASDHLLARLFRRLDRWTGYQMSPVSYVAVAYLLVRCGWVAWTSPLAPGWKVASLAALLGVAALLIYPLVALYNLVAWVVFRNPPLGLDKERYFPRSALLEDPATFRAIRRELEAALIAEGATRRFTDVFPNVTIVEEDVERARAASPSGVSAPGWRTLFLRLADREVPEGHARMPTVSAVLSRMPEVYNAFFSILDPGFGLAPHRGYFKGILRYHLGVMVPSSEDAWIVVGGQRYHWEEGAGILFDDMYVHHVENRCDAPRIVLFLDVRRPLGPVASAITESVRWMIDVHPYHRTLREKAGVR